MADTDILFRELEDLLVNYGKRLQVLRMILTDSGELDGLKLLDALTPIRHENQRALGRLRQGLEAARAKGHAGTVLDNVWKPERMKSMYYTVVQMNEKITTLLRGWAGRPVVLQNLRKHNEAILGTAQQLYINVVTGGSFIKDHLFGIDCLLQKFDQKALFIDEIVAAQRARKDLSSLLDFLNTPQETLATLKFLRFFSATAEVRAALGNDVFVRKQKFFMGENKKQEQVEFFLTATHLALRRIGIFIYIFDKWEVRPLEKVKFTESDHKPPFLTLFAFGEERPFRAFTEELFYEWMTTFKELVAAVHDEKIHVSEDDANTKRKIAEQST